MSEANPNLPPVSDKTNAANAKADKERDTDLARLAELQKEYATLRVKVERGAAVMQAAPLNPQAADLARKGEVVREMDAIKRKHKIP